MNSDEGKATEDYTQSDLQEYIDSIYDRYLDCGDKAVRKILRAKWKELTYVYNRRAQYGAYKEEL